MTQTQEPGKLVTTTVRDYDLSETSKLVRPLPSPSPPPVLLTPLPPQVRTAYLGILMMCGLHGYLGYTQPLFVQGVMGLKNLYDAKLVRIYVLGRAPEGDLKRPFKTGPGMFGGEFRSSFASFYFLPSI